MFIREGMKVRFCPDFMRSGYESPAEMAAKSVTGKILFVNWPHRVFSVEYECGGTKQIEAFKFCDIGKTVTIYG